MTTKLLLLPNDNYGMGILEGKDIIATSRAIAEMFGKRHDDVLKVIRNSGCSDNFRHRNFAESSYKNEQNKKQPQYLLTKDGFAFIVMGFTGKKAAQFKEAYINRFNEMEPATRLACMLALHIYCSFKIMKAIFI